MVSLYNGPGVVSAVGWGVSAIVPGRQVVPRAHETTRAHSGQSRIRNSMTAHFQETLAVGRRELNVRAEIDNMRIAALWQVLLPIAGEIRSVKISTAQTRDFADFTISFGCIPLAVLWAIVDRLGSMTWVTSVKLTPG